MTQSRRMAAPEQSSRTWSRTAGGSRAVRARMASTYDWEPKPRTAWTRMPSSASRSVNMRRSVSFSAARYGAVAWPAVRSRANQSGPPARNARV